LAEGVPVGTVQDAAANAMVWLGSALGVPAVPLEAHEFGQSGTVPDLYQAHDLTSGAIVNAATAAQAARTATG
jgi:pyruvate dehydrogenase E1 component